MTPMISVGDVLEALERIAPSRFAYSFDKVGLQVGSKSASVSRAVVTLDRSQGAIAYAAELGAELIVSHHPMIWDPLKSIVDSEHNQFSIQELIRYGINFVAAHTNWDSARGGVNDTLADRLGLMEVGSFGSGAEVESMKMVVFAPEASTPRIIDAASEAGAGKIGAYRRCAFVNPGQGTFVAKAYAKPSVGQTGKLETVDEYRIEMVVPISLRRQVEGAVRKAHPYEAAAVDFYTRAPGVEQPIGRMGHLEASIELHEFARRIDELLGTRCQAWGSQRQRVSKVAVVGGAADDEWRAAMAAGADVFVSGEIRQHVALEASESEMAMVAAGHYATEQPGCESLCERLADALPDIDWNLFVPPAGMHGRPI